MAWLKRAWAGWLGVVVPWLVILALFFAALPAVWWAVDQTGVLDVTWACGDLDNRAEAQEYLDSETEHGDEASMKNLDWDGDGKACENACLCHGCTRARGRRQDDPGRRRRRRH